VPDRRPPAVVRRRFVRVGREGVVTSTSARSFDGVPTADTVDRLYESLDFVRGVDDFWFRYVTDMGIAGPDRGRWGEVPVPATRS
jgi:hypothetical protein